MTFLGLRFEFLFLLYDSSESPSLKRLIPDIWLDCYQIAREDTLKKYELPAELFPIEPPLYDGRNSRF